MSNLPSRRKAEAAAAKNPVEAVRKEVQDYEDLEIAQQIRELVQMPGWQRITHGLRDTYLVDFCRSDPSDSEKRERIHVAINVLADIENEAKTLLSRGNQAEANIAKRTPRVSTNED